MAGAGLILRRHLPLQEALMTIASELIPYQQLGGDQPLRQLVDRFYDLMFSEQGVEIVRDMHNPDTR